MIGIYFLGEADHSTSKAPAQPHRSSVSCSIQKETFVCDQKESGLENRAMEQDDGFGFGIGGLIEVVGGRKSSAAEKAVVQACADL
jgi:hypothetical protein